MSAGRIPLSSAVLLFFCAPAPIAYVREFDDVGTPGNPMLVPIEWNKTAQS